MSLLDARLAALGLLVLAGTLPLAAQTLRVLEPAPMRSERSADAPTVASLTSGQGVTLLQMSGGWVRVQAGTARGWLRASQLEMPGAEIAAASQREAGRRQDGATAVTLGVRARPPQGERHALIIGIGEYQADAARPVPTLAGVAHDMVSALAMARALQVPMERVTLLRDGDATRQGVRQVLRELEGRLQPGDRVFIYWSGHGSRQLDSSEGGCVETLVPHDLRDIGQRELAQWLRPLTAKADPLLVIHDVGASVGAAGVGRASVAGLRPGFEGLVPKYTAGDLACSPPRSLRRRGWGSALREAGVPAQAVVHVASSRPDEASLDDAETGGLATSALRHCLLGNANDLSGTGALSVEELVSCAQARIDARLRHLPQLLPQHLVVTGNRNLVPATFGVDPTRP